MPPPEKPTQSWSTHDKACQYCRARKIRCGREKPNCSNCQRDDIECMYVNQGKRVNHVKLLCSNVESMDNRLRDIESGLSRLASMLMANNQPSCRTAPEEDSSPLPQSQDDEPLASSPTDRHVVRGQDDLLDRYYGPCTLFSLCNEFRQDKRMGQKIEQAVLMKSNYQNNSRLQTSSKREEIEDLLKRLCHEAVESPSSVQEEPVPIRLPPKQFLSMVQIQFFNQDDYRTNIFVRSSFSFNVDRLYRSPYSPTDEAWAVCFNTIILLVLSTDTTCHGGDPLVESQFALPFRRTFGAAVTNLSSLMQPKLINVQALALMSVAAQKFYPPSVSESIFMQACVLAKRMGLHQMHRRSPEISLEESEERHVVFRSLYLRDKSFLISRGSICWLHTFDSNLSTVCGEIDFPSGKHSARLQLAAIQEDIYRSFRSADSMKHSTVKRQNSLARIKQSLEHWLNNHNGPFFTSLSSRTNIRDIEIYLEFLATRISAFFASSNSSLRHQAIADSRASCVAVLLVCGKHDPSMIHKLEASLLPKPTSLPEPIDNASSNISDSGDAGLPIESELESHGETLQLQFHSLLDTFPAIALFVLANDILYAAPLNDSQAEEDFILLQKVSSCYKELHAKTQANNRTRQVGRTLELLLKLLGRLQNFQSNVESPEPLDSITVDDLQPNKDSHSPFDSELLDSYTFTPMTPSFSTPLLQSWNSLSMQSRSGGAEGDSMDNSHDLLSPMDMGFLTGVFDSDEQQIMMPFSKPESRKRIRVSEPEIPGSGYQ